MLIFQGTAGSTSLAGFTWTGGPYPTRPDRKSSSSPIQGQDLVIYQEFFRSQTDASQRFWEGKKSQTQHF